MNMFEIGIVLIKGFIVGFSLAMTVGPISLFCIQQTLRRGFKAGLAAGLGAATADGIYGAVAGLGLTVLGDFLIKQQLILQLIGGSFLLYLGVSIFHSMPTQAAVPPTGKKDLLGLFTSTLFLTLANPLTIFGFAALISSIGIKTESAGASLAMSLFSGLFLGSATWWLILTGILSTFRTRISMHLIHWLNRAAGVAIAGFGALVLIQSLHKLF